MVVSVSICICICIFCPFFYYNPNHMRKYVIFVFSVFFFTITQIIRENMQYFIRQERKVRIAQTKRKQNGIMNSQFWHFFKKNKINAIIETKTNKIRLGNGNLQSLSLTLVLVRKGNRQQSYSRDSLASQQQQEEEQEDPTTHIGFGRNQ